MESMDSFEAAYNIIFQCTKTGESEKTQIKVKPAPVDILEVKEQIEKDFSIPVCVQTLCYESYPLRNDTVLSSMRIRAGDTFHVKYLARGHCSEIKEFIAWLKQVLEAMTHRSLDLYTITDLNTQYRLFNSLWNCLWPDSPATEYVNSMHFMCAGGLEAAMALHAILLQSPWRELSTNMKYLESSLVGAIRGVGGAQLSHIVAKLNGTSDKLALWIQGFLRVSVEEGKSIRDYEPSSDFDKTELEHAVCGSAIVLNILVDELPKYHIEVASNKAVLNQLSTLLLSPSLKPMYLDIIPSIFLTLAFTPGTHKYIADSVHIGRLLQVCRRTELPTEPNDIQFWYFTCLFLAHVCLVSPQYIQSDWRHTIYKEIELFLFNTSTKRITEIEIEMGYVWTTFLSTIKVVFIPNLMQTEGSIDELQLASLKLILFSLQANLSRESHREVLLKEGLLDYVMCMPQYVPASLRPQAEELVRMVASAPDIPEGPPKLLNLVKARLAKMHFGLEQVLSLSVSEVINTVL